MIVWISHANYNVFHNFNVRSNMRVSYLTKIMLTPFCMLLLDSGGGDDLSPRVKWEWVKCEMKMMLTRWGPSSITPPKALGLSPPTRRLQRIQWYDSWRGIANWRPKEWFFCAFDFIFIYMSMGAENYQKSENPKIFIFVIRKLQILWILNYAQLFLWIMLNFCKKFSFEILTLHVY